MYSVYSEDGSQGLIHIPFFFEMVSGASDLPSRLAWVTSELQDFICLYFFRVWNRACTTHLTFCMWDLGVEHRSSDLSFKASTLPMRLSPQSRSAAFSALIEGQNRIQTVQSITLILSSVNMAILSHKLPC